MNDLSLSSPRFLEGAPSPSWLDMLARRKLLQRLGAIADGRLLIRESDTCRIVGSRNSDCELTAEISVRDPRFYSDVAFGGSIGAAEAYIRGYWDCADLTSLVRVLLRNRAVLDGLEGGFARLKRPLAQMFHWFNRNTHKGSRKNISAHYDLGNEFFALWLDERMMYSSAIYERPNMNLDEASVAKLERICRKLDLQAEDHLLEIGTGWGGLAIYAAQQFGCRVTTTTISKEQHKLAQQRVAAAGLGDRVTLLLKDYRELDGQFDKLVSVEMIEAVGQENYRTYFDACCRLLKSEGLMCLQSITIADQQYASALKSVDFIQRYIFPGGCLPSVTAIADCLTASTDMRITHCEDIGLHYATTLQHWRERFIAQLDSVRELGYSSEFVRLWKYYLGYCEGAFIERAIGNVQLLIARPANRRLPYLG